MFTKHDTCLFNVKPVAKLNIIFHYLCTIYENFLTMVAAEQIKELQQRVDTLGRCINIEEKRADVQ